ncbi:MAG: hypothetical protein KQJ78_21820 [Deltaproteobacteria bacterium]|nr:hypothetical protein [Deltaproteobacteria bacterium]
MRFLVVEEEAALAQEIAAALGGWRHQVHLVATPDEALAACGRAEFDAAFYDVSEDEPDLSTLSALGEARPGMVLVAMAKHQYYRPEMEERLRGCGIRYYTIKPPGGGKLLQRVIEHLVLRLEITARAS